MKKKDYILIALVLFIAIGGLILYKIFSPSTDGEDAKVIISVSGVKQGEYPLHKNAVIEIPAEYGTNVLEIKDGEVFMESAECPDQICVYHPKIHNHGDMIICLPNEIIVEISGGDKSETDSTSQ